MITNKIYVEEIDKTFNNIADIECFIIEEISKHFKISSNNARLLYEILFFNDNDELITALLDSIKLVKQYMIK